MKLSDIEALARGIAPAIDKRIHDVMQPLIERHDAQARINRQLMQRNAELEQRIADLEEQATRP